MIKLYRLLTFLFLPIIVVWLFFRVTKGKEVLHRLKEKFGYSTVKRHKGPYIWLHGASVGESLVALTLSKHLKTLYPKYNFLITTGTVTSAKILSSRISDNIIHQFIPIDEYFALNRFFSFWHPKLGIFIESEIWPNLISTSANYCPIILANAIISKKSFNRWSNYRNVAFSLFNMFDLIICQNKTEAEKYKKLCNSDVEFSDNLKYSSAKPYVNDVEIKILKQSTENRVIFLAASTHKGEEEIICRIHKSLSLSYPRLLTIIVPRHPERRKEISDIISSYKINYAIRSIDEKISPKVDIYLADTLGELALFFSVADISFIGGSFMFGGHNILEAAYFDTKIIVGPDMRNSTDITKEFLSASAIMQAMDEKDLESKIRQCLEEENSNNMIENARKILLGKTKVIDYYTHKISSYL